MTMCIICNQRTAQVRNKYCHHACYAMSPEGVLATREKHTLKALQKAARTAALQTNGGAATGDASLELRALRDNDDGVDR